MRTKPLLSISALCFLLLPPRAWAGPAPTGFTGTATSVSSINWSWNLVSGATSYNLYLATSPTTLVASTPALSYQAGGLTANTNYGLYVTAMASGVESALSASATTYTLANLPTVPTFSNLGSSSFTITWVGANPTYTPYQIELAPNNSFGVGTSTPVRFSDNLTASSATILGLTPNTLYFVRVAARNGGLFISQGPASSVTTKPNGTGTSSGSGVGTATLAPASIPEGGVVTSTVTFTVPSGGMSAGGRLEIDLPPTWWPSILQNNNSTQDGYVSVTSTAAVALNLFFDNSSPNLSVSFSSGTLPAGTLVKVSIANIHPNCPPPNQTQVTWEIKSARAAADSLGHLVSQPSQTFTAGQAQWVGYNPWNPLAVVANQASQAITLQASDNCGQPAILASSLRVDLQALLPDGSSADSGASFSTSPSFATLITSATIPAASSTTVYYYKTSTVGNNLQIRGNYASPVGANNQQVWRQTNVIATAPTLGNVAIDNGIPVAGQKTLTLSPDGSGTNNFAYIRFTPSDTAAPWHVLISSTNFQTTVFERWGNGDPQGMVSWDGRNYNMGGTAVNGGPQTVPNGTYAIKVDMAGLVTDTSLSITINTSQISGNVTLGGVPVQGANVNAQGMNTPGYSFTTTDAAGNYVLNGVRAGFQYNLNVNYVNPANQAVVTGQRNSVSAPASGQDFALTTPGVIRVSAVIPSSATFPVFGSVNIHSADYSQNYWGNIRLLAGTTASDNGDSFNPSTWTVLYVQPGSYIVHLFVPGYGSNDVTASANSDVVVNLQHKASVYGLLTLPAPAANSTWVSVEGVLQGNSYPTVWGGASFTSGQSSAIYSVFAVDAGVYTFRARPDGYVPLSLTGVTVSAADIGNPQTGGLDFSGFSTGGHISGSVTVNGDTSLQPNPFTLWISAYSPSLGANVFTQVLLSTSASSTSASYQLNGMADGSYQLFAPFLPGFEGSVSGPQNVTVSGGAAARNLTLNQVTGRVRGSVLISGVDYANVHLSLQGPYQRDVDLSAGTYSLDNLGTGNYTLVATYRTTGAQTTTSFILSNGQTLALDLDLSAPTHSVTGTVSVQNAFSIRNSSNSLVTINTLANLLANATSQTVYLNGTNFANSAGGVNGCGGGTPTVLSTVRVEAFPKSFNSFNNANRSNFNNCFGVGQYNYALVDSSGNYTISGLSSGVWEISVYPYFDGGQVPNAAVSKQIVTVVNGDITGVNFPLSNGYSVSGSINLPAGVTDTRSFNAQLLSPRGDLIQSAPLSVTSANSGSYQFSGLPSGQYSLLIQDMGTYDQTLNRNVIKYVSKPTQFTIAGADLGSVNVTLSRASSIVGKLLVQGANPDGTTALTLITPNNQNLLPMNFHIGAEANPWIPGGFGQAEFGMNGGIFIDDNNQFHIDGLTAGTYDVRFSQDSFGLAIQGGGSLNIASLTKGSVQVAESQTVDLGTVALTPGLSLSGTVKNTSGAGLANIRVEGSPAHSTNKNGTDTIQVFTDAQGNFTLAGLNPSIKVYNIIVARRPDPNDTSSQPVPYGSVSKLAVDVTQVPAPSLDFVLPSAAAQLTGKVVTVDAGALSYPEKDNGGFPVAAIYVRSQGSINEDNPLGDASATFLDGTFSIPYIPAGTYDITVESLGYRPLRLAGVTLTNGAKDLGTLTLQKGPSLQVTLAKPDGSSVNTSDVHFAVAATADLGSIIFGQIISDANTDNITSIKFSGFELAPKTYSLLLFDNQDNIIVPPEGRGLAFVLDTDSVVKAITYQPTAPLAFAHVRKVGSSVVLTYYLSRPLRNRGDDADPTPWFTLTSGAGTLSAHSISPDRRQVTVTYNPIAGEQNARITFSAHTVDIDPSTGVEFVIAKSITLLLGQKATAENNINPALGGSVSLSDNSDPSSISVPSNAFLSSDGSQADISTSYPITFSATDDSTIVANAMHASAAQVLAPMMELGAQAYVSEAYEAMQKLLSNAARAAAGAGLNPFSAFYSVLLPAGLSHTLNQTAALTLSYSSDADPQLVNVYYFNGVEYLRENTNRIVDTQNHTITVSVNHFSTFVVLQNDVPVVVTDGESSAQSDIEVFNFPNPFNLQTKTKDLARNDGTTTSMSTDGTIIRFTIPAAKGAAAGLTIFNVVGEKVRSIDLGTPSVDTYHYVAWDGKNDSGHNVASGVYIGVLKVGGAKKMWKMAVIK